MMDTGTEAATACETNEQSAVAVREQNTTQEDLNSTADLNGGAKTAASGSDP